MKPLTRMLSLLLAITLIAAACGSDDEVVDETTTTEAAGAASTEATATTEAMSTTEATATTEAMSTTEAMADEPGTIVDVAVGAGSFTTLVAAVQAAGLVDTLSGDGPFTVLAPTDDAFAAALEALGLTAEELLASEDLASILTYHVIPGEVLAETVVTLDGQDVETVNGATVAISVTDGAVMVNDANVVTTDVMASNGVIHVIDAVLLPPAE